MKFLNLLAPIRSLIVIMIYPFFTMTCSVAVILMNLIFNNRKIDNALIKFWAGGTCFLFNVKVKVFDVHKIPVKMGCLYLFNHQSFFDIWSMSGFLPSFRFGAKIELFRIPFFGKAIRRVGVLPINRERKESVFRVYDWARERMIAGDRYALSPEGTRQLEPVLAPFKSGPFIFAIQSQAPVVPIVIKNANNVMPKNSFIPNLWHWSQTITIEVLDPIETKNMSVEDKKKLMDLVFEKMNEVMKKPSPLQTNN